jgi:hypothetical protein
VIRWHRVLPLAALATVAMAGGASAGTPFPATLQAIQDSVFTPRCSFCHYEGSFLGAWLDNVDNAFDTLVNQDARFCAGETRVIPYDADGSYLIRKLEGTNACGDQMPLGDAPLDQATIDVIRAWIDNGAFKEEPVAISPATWGMVKTLQMLRR